MNAQAREKSNKNGMENHNNKTFQMNFQYQAHQKKVYFAAFILNYKKQVSYMGEKGRQKELLKRGSS